MKAVVRPIFVPVNGDEVSMIPVPVLAGIRRSEPASAVIVLDAHSQSTSFALKLSVAWSTRSASESGRS